MSTLCYILNDILRSNSLSGGYYMIRFTSSGIPGADSYDPTQFIQDLIGTIDWISRFNRHY